MRLAVIGANGLLGSNVVETGIRRGHDIVGTYHSTPPSYDIPLERLDIIDSKGVRQFLENAAPDAAANCAAMTDVDACKENPERAFDVNAAAPAAIAEMCESRDIRFGHVSTDYVFDGTAETPYSEEDGTNPVQEYGASKLAGEQGIQKVMTEPLIARLSFVWGVHQSDDELTGFPRWVRDALLDGDSIPLFTDQFVTPTRAGQAASVLIDLLDSEETGTFNVACRSCVTPFEFGTEILDRCERDSGDVQQSSLATMDRPAERPAYTCLQVDRIEETRGRPQPTLAEDVDAVADYI